MKKINQADEANKIAKNANLISRIALGVSFIALLVAILKGCK